MSKNRYIWLVFFCNLVGNKKDCAYTIKIEIKTNENYLKYIIEMQEEKKQMGKLDGKIAVVTGAARESGMDARRSWQSMERP